MKKILILILTLVLTITGCGTKTDNENKQLPGTVISNDDGTRCIIDQAGRSVKIPKKVSSIAYCYRIPARLLISLGLKDKVKGVGKTDDFIDMVAPEFKNLPCVGQGVVDIEAIANLKPDVVFHKASDKDGLEAIEKLGIASVGILVENDEEMLTALNIMGEICNVKEEAKKASDYYKEQITNIQNDIKSVKEKPTVLMIGDEAGKVANKEMLQGKMIDLAGGINVANEISTTKSWPTVGIEQICTWNPDYIFLSGSGSKTFSLEEFMKDSRFKDLKAVKDMHVYQMPLSVDSWEFPGMSSILGIKYIINKIHPDICSIEELRKNANDFYNIFYDTNLLSNEIEMECK